MIAINASFVKQNASARHFYAILSKFMHKCIFPRGKERSARPLPFPRSMKITGWMDKLIFSPLPFWRRSRRCSASSPNSRNRSRPCLTFAHDAPAEHACNERRRKDDDEDLIPGHASSFARAPRLPLLRVRSPTGWFLLYNTIERITIAAAAAKRNTVHHQVPIRYTAIETT